ncbi:MAG: hypothetical protein ACRERS_02705 [Methylococcales bacterium]
MIGKSGQSGSSAVDQSILGQAPGQAEAVSRAFQEASGEAEISTKQDLREVELRLEAKINDIKFDLVKWIAGMLLAQTGLVAALVKLL